MTTDLIPPLETTPSICEKLSRDMVTKLYLLSQTRLNSSISIPKASLLHPWTLCWQGHFFCYQQLVWWKWCKTKTGEWIGLITAAAAELECVWPSKVVELLDQVEQTPFWRRTPLWRFERLLQFVLVIQLPFNQIEAMRMTSQSQRTWDSTMPELPGLLLLQKPCWYIS